MQSRTTLKTKRSLTKTAWFILIVVAATAAGMLCAWRAPGLNLYARDWLMRTRGSLAEPNDIVIVAIDEPSIAKLGQFPWRRDYTARVLNAVSASEPRAIALDILYSEPTDEANDKALTDAIKQSGNVVISEQLVEDRDTPELSRSIWLRSLPAIENAAAGVGHVNVETESDGAARQMLLRLADDDGESRWALALETVRVGDKLSPADVSETSRFIRIGTRKLPFDSVEHNLSLKLKDAGSNMTTIQPLRMTIDYIGPTGSFAAQTYSFSDVLEGRVSPEKFRGKYVLIGATAATLGDRIAAPFVHTENAEGDQHGDLMPGVEILANSVNTILRGHFYQPVSDWTAALCAALIALAVLFLTSIAQGKFEAAKQLGVLAGLALLILSGSYFAFVYASTIPPIVPMTVSFIVAAPLVLLQRSLAASVGLDERIGELLAAENRLLIGRNKNLESDFDNNFFENDDAPLNFPAGRFFPKGLEQKTQTLGFLSRDLIAHTLFVDRALRSLEEGLLIADANGRITFANESAVRILGLSERKLIGSNLLARLNEAKQNSGTWDFDEDILAQLILDRKIIEREFVSSEAHHYTLRMSPVAAREKDFQETLGVVATLSDVTPYRELQKTQNDVIALVTHELRTPLTAIQGMSEILTEHDVEPESRRKMLAAINTEAKRLARMITEYLDITRLESGMQKARFTFVDITELLERTLLMLEPIAAKRGIEIVRRFSENLITISADAEMLALAFTNIVANAIKYSPEKTKITVETYSAGEMLQINFTDQGYGINAEQLPHIFEKFYRVPHRQNTEVSGTGLGLALTREIVELHGGRIKVESEPNEGSTFTVFLPFAPDNKNIPAN
ncbi:MAG TPA: CHASE2 domain-containing protein [Pyrinomonadaceae bacterium]|jgi:PAS domain S-box-containing protein